MLKEQERVRKDRDREMRLRARQDEEVLSTFASTKLHMLCRLSSVRAMLGCALLSSLDVL